MTTATFTVGDRVRLSSGPWTGRTGVLAMVQPDRVRVGVTLDQPVVRRNGERSREISAQVDWLERIDAAGEADRPRVTHSAGMAGPPSLDGSGPRPAGERAETAEETIAALRDIVAAQSRSLPPLGRTTTRRMRVNVTKNTKGYSYDTTYEVTTDDPDLNLSLHMAWGLGETDRLARQEIDNRTYIDEHGPAGAEDDQPF
jgi:hypothetical protein